MAPVTVARIFGFGFALLPFRDPKKHARERVEPFARGLPFLRRGVGHPIVENVVAGLSRDRIHTIMMTALHPKAQAAIAFVVSTMRPPR